MKICFITPAYYPALQWGGPVASVRLLAEELVKAGDALSVFTTSFGLEQNQNQQRELGGVEIFYFRFLPIGRWFVSWNLLKSLWRKRNEFNLFHIHLTWDPICWLAGMLLALSGKRFVFSPRGALKRGVVDKRSARKKRLVYFLFLRFIFRHAAGFHFTSKDEAVEFFEFTRMQGKKFRVISNPADLSNFAAKAEPALLEKWGLEGKRYFLYLGRINWVKALDILADAFENFSQSEQGFYLVFAGPDGGHLEKLQVYIQGFKARGQMLFTGLVEGQDKVALLQNAQALVLPSHSENFGMVVAEAMASDVPVVISDKVGIRDLVERYGAGLIFANGEDRGQAVKELTEQLRVVIKSEQRQKLIAAGRKLVLQELESQAIAQQMQELYQEALSNKK